MSKLDYKIVKEEIKEKLLFEREFDDSQNLLELGLNSLQIMRLMNQWRKQGISVSFAELMENPTFGAWYNILNKPEKREEVEYQNKEEKKIEQLKVNQLFPLTDVQYSYWIGRGDEQPLGGVGCHAYLEFDGRDIEIKKLEDAWKKLQYHHSMLRAKFSENGMQQILEKPYSQKIIVNDFRNLKEAEVKLALEEVRDKLSHRRLEVSKGQVAGLELSLLPKGMTKVHFDLDLLVADVQSLQILLRDLVDLYQGKKLPEESKKWDFAAYLKEQERIDRATEQEAVDYWKKRLDSLPIGPDLPLRQKPEQLKETRFNRRVINLEKEDWNQLQRSAAKYQTTPAMVLLTVYVKVLERWSLTDHFLINVPLFNRKTEIKGIEEVVADFTALFLLEVDCREQQSFVELLKNIQKQVHQDMAYANYSGVQVQREMAKLHIGQQNIAPVVFACNLGTPLINQDFERELGSLSYMISQTPQVWIDFQTYETEDGLLLAWDTVDELFPENMIEDMMSAFKQLLYWLVEAKSDWESDFDLLPEDQKKERRKEVKIEMLELKNCIHTAFFDQVEKNPDRTALIDSASARILSYGDVSTKALSIAVYLKNRRICEEAIAITLARGINQIVAVLGVLASTNCYVPVSVSQPVKRREIIHKEIGISYVITDRKTKQIIDWSENIEVFVIEDMELEEPLQESMEVFPESTAYIIMTSGSTGEPKGVEIQHYSAWNTIEDINQRYGVNQEDSLLAVSALDFDLSVYDIFGVLGAGGQLVLIPEEGRRDAAYWLEQVKRYNISLWNSVPILLDMLLIAAEGSGEKELPLRLVMLSGDWIGMELPEKVAQLTDNCRFIAMGGATEASIWSNYYEVELPLPSHWKSIPYGRSLSHQAYRVVDSKARDCPNWVKGELWIGGAGVAKGYRGKEELTSEKFVTDQGLRWYKTGDKGRFWNDGMIEFLGREDFQVKIRGHRIELGEIETALKQYPGVTNAVVTINGEEQENKYLRAYCVVNQESAPLLFKEITGSMDINQKIWNSLSQLEYRESSVNFAEEIKVEDIPQYMEYLNGLSLEFIFDIFREIGLFKARGESYRVFEIMEQFKIDPRNKELVKRWVNILATAGILEKGSDEQYHYKKHLSALDLKLKRDYSECTKEIDCYIQRLRRYGVSLLKGEVEAVEVFYGGQDSLSLNELLKLMPGNDRNISSFIQSLQTVVENLLTDQPVKILEVGTRNLEVSKQILEALEGYKIEYTYLAESKFFIEDAKKALSKYSFVEYGLFDEEKDLQRQGYELHSYDCFLAFNSLHRANNIDLALRNISRFLLPSGILIMSEMTIDSYLLDITAGFLEEGFSYLEDERSLTGTSIQSTERWEEALHNSGFVRTKAFPQEYGRGVIIGQFKDKVNIFQAEKLEDYLCQKLPKYMVPKNYICIDQLPITANGKLDRKALAVNFIDKRVRRDFTKPKSNTEKRLAKLWTEIFDIEEIGLYDNYFELGGDSLIATKLIASIRKEFAKDISLGTVFKKPTIYDLALAVDNIDGEQKRLDFASEVPIIIPDKDNKYAEFPLTDVQYAYWIGRSGLYELGNVSTHCYFELDSENLDIEKLNRAWNCLIKHHDMMRAVIPDGRQKILERVPEYEIELRDLRRLSQQEAQNSLEKVRSKMSHQVLTTDSWPLFEVKASIYDKDKVRLHISFDNLIFDGWSMFHILSEWTKLYHNDNLEFQPLELSFRDYVLGLEQLKETNLYQKSKRYWIERIDTLPAAPELPLAKGAQALAEQRFYRRRAKLDKVDWKVIKRKANVIDVTPSVLLITAYAEVLRMWSKNVDFTINLTQFNRVPMHRQVSEIVGDFTTLTLLEINRNNCSNFIERAQKIQKQLLLDLEHSYFNGVEVQRELAKNHGDSGVIIPIVFTSGLGIDYWKEEEWLGELVYNISQTPQVWLDHQVVESDGDLVLFWDSVDELFCPGMLDEMFSQYYQFLKRLTQEDDIWEADLPSSLNLSRTETMIKANQTEGEISTETLDSLLLKATKRYENQIAVITEEKRFSYKELVSYASVIAGQLKKEGVRPQDTVAIIMNKGWEQIVAVYAVLFAEAVYLPIDPVNPQERISEILADSGVETLLCQSWILQRDKWLREKNYIEVDKIKVNTDQEEIRNSNSRPDSPAYVIYTSGSTGKPKGVVIDHQGAVNTILDVNRRFNIGNKDRLLALSNLNFDLSVYDIFGILAAGGTIILPNVEEEKDPAHWIELINREGVTIWNSVPMFMQMLIEFIKGNHTEVNQSLRVVLLSGDWIPLTLSDEIKSYFTSTKVIALGGATEASIWSNYFEVVETDDCWKSIPYGWPLKNQKYYILNEFMMNCPTWVSGKLYIGGLGLARGYLNDIEKTNEKFILHPTTGERLYYTGDLGRYDKNGCIEFLGREDSQVKVRGYRIELGEIEAIIKSYDSVKESVVTTIESSNGNVKLVCFILLEEDEQKTFKEEDLIDFLKDKLPKYMIPTICISLESMPLTANGKIDRKYLLKLAQNHTQKKEVISPKNEIEKSIAKAWKEILKYDDISIYDNFFEYGGDSLRAIEFINLLKRSYGYELSLQNLFNLANISEIANKISKDRMSFDEGVL
ncbi:MAG: amino acid adenylation domain-containing protein [Firmicutes bacterium]|nr:amino acid adenylation domain-containing protein [Bacillota bacterium]